jgi:putative membrane protein
MTAVSDVRPGPRPFLPAALACGVLVVLVLSGWHPHDRMTWFLEVVWVLVGLPLLVVTRRRFPLTGLLYCLLAAHAVVLMVGGHYTYAEVPLGDLIRDVFGLDRNPYDRFGHLMQGFVPAVLVRELLVRTSPLRGSRWLAPLTVCACLAFSAVFEMLEWAAAVAGGHAADAFLATQGDVWDTQWDMFLCLCGAATSLLLFSRWHDRQLGAVVLAGK